MKYKLLALDIDGTVAKEHTNLISPKVIRAIQQAKEKVHVSLVSARARKDQEEIVKILRLEKSYHVLENGTKVINPQGKLEYNKHIPTTEVQQIINLTSDYFDDIGFCIDSRWTKDYQNPQKEIVSVLSLISKSREKAELIPNELKKLNTLYSVTVGNHWKDPSWAVTLISHKDASKGKGLNYIQKKLVISPKETIAIGDGASDIPVMEFAKEKVAMGNAEEKLKIYANYIAPSIKDDGVVEVINKFLL